LIDEMAAEGIHIRHIDFWVRLGVTYAMKYRPPRAA